MSHTKPGPTDAPEAVVDLSAMPLGVPRSAVQVVKDNELMFQTSSVARGLFDCAVFLVACQILRTLCWNIQVL